MNQHTPAQIKAIQTWTEQRDSLLREIGVHTTERDERKKEADAQALRLSDLQTSVAEARGRIAELEALEDRHKTSVSIEVSELEARKSRLTAECIALDGDIASKKGEHELIVSATTALSDATDTMKDQAQVVKSVVSDIIETGKGALSDAKVIIGEIRTVADEVIAKGNANVEQTNIVIDKLPRFIFDMQKPIPVRRTYPPGHPNHEVTPAS